MYYETFIVRIGRIGWVTEVYFVRRSGKRTKKPLFRSKPYTDRVRAIREAAAFVAERQHFHDLDAGCEVVARYDYVP